MSSRLGSMVVRLALENLAGYKADLNQAATDTKNAADKIEQGTGKATTGITRMGGAMGGVADTAVSLASSAGLAGAAAGALAIGIGAAAYAAHQGSKEQQAYQRALILTGNVSGVTASQMQGMAAGIDKVIGTQAQASAALTAMANTGLVAGANLQAFAQVAVQAERVVGTSVEDTAKVFAQLGEEPVKASLKLNQSMNYLTAATFEQIKAAKDLGDSETAASIAQNAYASALASRTEQIRANLGTLERAWIGVKDLAKEAWDSMMGLGRQSGPEQALESAKNAVTNLEALLARGGTGTGDIQRKLDAARGYLATMQESARLDAKAARWQADQVESDKARISWMQEGDRYLSKEEKLQQAIAKIRFEGARAGADELEIQKRINFEKEKAAGKGHSGKSAQEIELEKQAALLATLSGVNADYLQQLDRLQRMREKGNVSEAQYVELVTVLISKQPSAIAFTREAIEAAKANTKAVDDLYEAQEKLRLTNENQIKTGRTMLEQIQFETALLDMNAQQRAVATMERELERQGIVKGTQAYTAYIEKLREATELKGMKEASIKQAEETAKAWQKAADKINDSITDALMRGFESGKGFVANLRDTAVNMFKTMVLRPIISPVGNMLAGGGMGGMGGIGGAANAASGIGGIGNAASAFSIGGLGNPFTNIGGFMGNGVADLGSFLVDKGFTSVGTSMESFGLTMKANEAAINGFGDALGYANSAMLASEGKWGAAVGSAVGTYFGGPIGAAIGQAVGGWVDEAFGGGHEYTTGTGISGSFGASGFSGRNYQDWRNDGSSGFFGIGASGSSSGTNYSALDASTAKGLSSAFMAVRGQTAGFAKALGLSDSSIMGFSKDIKLGLGSDAEANKKAISDLLTGIADDLAKTVLDSQYIRDGETAASTLARLSTNLQAVNQVFDTLDFNMLGISQAGGDAASQLVDLMGGLESFQSTASRFNQNYYSEAERNAKTTEQLSDSFAGLGLAMPGSLQGFRDLVKEQDVSTDSGRAMVAALMGMSDAFYTVTKAATDAQASLLQTKFFTSYSDYAAASAQAGVTAAPKFAAGGDHTGGLRWVGERGMELEATGASRIWNAGQLSAALQGNAGGSASLMQALLEQSRAQGRALVSLMSQMVDRLERWEVRGMPEVRTL